MCSLSVISDLDECSAETSPCNKNADCSNSDGSYSCTCKQGFTGDGVICTGRLLRLTDDGVREVLLLNAFLLQIQ